MDDNTLPLAAAKPKPGEPGHNKAPDYGTIAAQEMTEKYSKLAKTIQELLAEAAALPKEVNDDETMGLYAKLVKRFRDISGQLEEHHGVEKEPYLRGGQAIDRYFFGWLEKVARRKKTDKAGAADILQARVDDYMQRKAAAERARRDEELRKAQEVERQATAKRLADEQAARDRLAAAERAKKPENVEAHRDAAADHAAAAIESKADETVARSTLADAAEAAGAKTADMVRTRVSDDTQVTMQQVSYCEVTDVDKLDAVALWPFIKDDAKIAACKAWAKTTGHKRKMAGAEIGFRDKTRIV